MTTNQNSTKENAYILRTATDESYDTMEEKFFGAKWEPRLDSVEYLESLMSMYPEKFAGCEIIQKDGLVYENKEGDRCDKITDNFNGTWDAVVTIGGEIAAEYRNQPSYIYALESIKEFDIKNED